ncbi:hypothetical protein PMX22_09820 [Clostridium butyricum]|uniref:hypothetical protein n=1 Tax=Clostridium butyricum TaxID=1492 RepID=UPI00232E2CC8|nr:hypothetical protein [Clostridium butyricum]MDB2160097.1 hypothetical protein [Clostridium butyricum]
MSTIQLKDFASAEHSLNGQEYSFISQNDKTRKVDLDTLKKFIVGTGTLLTSDQSSIINAINELQQDILNQSGGTGVLQTEIDNIKKDYISKTKDLLNSYQVGTIETNLIPTVQALTDVYDLLNGMIITINSNIGDKSKLGTIDTTNLVNAINEINNGLKNIEIVTQELDNLIGGTFDVSTEGSLVDKIGNLKTMIETNKPIWDDKYTKAEIDNKISQLITNLDWKESVTTFDDIATTYPTPEDGWTVNVKDTDITYRYNGTTWIDISANAIPLATSTVDGKMSKQDKIDHDDMVTKRHIHTNKSVLDGITSALITAWNSAVTHISDTVKHITSAERNLWNTVSNKSDKGHKHTKSEITDMPTQVSQFENDAGYITQADVDTSQNHTHTNKSVLDTITQSSLDTWNTVSDKLDKSGGTVTGRIIVNEGVTVKSLNGGAGTSGYMYIARITVARPNQDQPIKLDIQQRNRYGSIVFQFANSSSTDPPLLYIRKMGNIRAYMYKSGTGTWELYVQKSESYDVIDVITLGKGEYMNYLNIEWKGVTVTSMPSGFVTASTEFMDLAVTKATQDSDGNQINTTYVKKGTTWDEMEGI